MIRYTALFFLSAVSTGFAADLELVRASVSRSGLLVVTVHQYSEEAKMKRPRMFVEFNDQLHEIGSHDLFVTGSQTGQKSILIEFFKNVKAGWPPLDRFQPGREMTFVIKWKDGGKLLEQKKVLTIEKAPSD